MMSLNPIVKKKAIHYFSRDAAVVRTVPFIMEREAFCTGFITGLYHVDKSEPRFVDMELGSVKQVKAILGYLDRFDERDPDLWPLWCEILLDGKEFERFSRGEGEFAEEMRDKVQRLARIIRELYYPWPLPSYSSRRGYNTDDNHDVMKSDVSCVKAACISGYYAAQSLKGVSDENPFKFLGPSYRDSEDAVENLNRIGEDLLIRTLDFERES